MGPEHNPEDDISLPSDEALQKLASQGAHYLPTDHTLGSRPGIEEIRKVVCETLLPRWMERYQRKEVLELMVMLQVEPMEKMFEHLLKIRDELGGSESNTHGLSEQERRAYINELLQEIDDPADHWKKDADSSKENPLADIQAQMMEMLGDPRSFIRKLVQQHRAMVSSPQAIAKYALHEASKELLTRNAFISGQRQRTQQASSSFFLQLAMMTKDDPKGAKIAKITEDFLREAATSAANRRCLVISERILSRLSIVAQEEGIERLRSPEVIKVAIRQELPRREDFIDYADEKYRSITEAQDSLKKVLDEIKKVLLVDDEPIPGEEFQHLADATDQVYTLSASLTENLLKMYRGFQVEDAEWIYG